MGGWEAMEACGVCGVFASEDVASDIASKLSGLATKEESILET